MKDMLENYVLRFVGPTQLGLDNLSTPRVSLGWKSVLSENNASRSTFGRTFGRNTN